MLSKIRTQAVLLSAVPLTALLVILLLAVSAEQKAREMTYWAQHSETVLSASSELQQSLGTTNHLAVEAASTRKAADDAQYKAADADLSKKAARLVQLVSDNPLQRKRARNVATVFAKAQRVMADYVAAGFARDKAKQAAIERDPGTRRLGTDLDRAVAAFDGSERKLAVLRFSAYAAGFDRYTTVLMAASIGAIALTLGTMTFFGLRIVYRLHHLGENARRLGEGEAPIALGGTDEIAELDRQYREMAKRMRHERQIASTLQQALLPQRLPEIAGLRIDTAYAPASDGDQVGGDWYDVFHVAGNVYGLSIGDVAGHGLDAARTMATLRQSIRTAALLTNDTSEVLAAANRLLCNDPDHTIATAFFGLFDTVTGTMKYSIGGHPSPIVLRSSGEARLLDGVGMILGVSAGERFDTYETQLQNGTALLLYTDGIIEMDRDYDRGLRRLMETAGSEQYRSTGNIAAAIQHRIFERSERRDDSALLFVAVTELNAPRSSESRTWSLNAHDSEAAGRAKRALLWHIGELAHEQCDLSAIELIFGELIGNVSRHTPGTADVTLEISGDVATLHVKDFGAPFSLNGTAAPDDWLEGGRGLFLIRSLARSLTVERHDRGNCVSAVLPADISRVSHTTTTRHRPLISR